MVAASSHRQLADLVLHLVRRDLASTHRFTLLGWMWPLIRQLAQLAVLVFVFSNVLQLGIPNFPAYVFAGLLAWTWFASGISAATASLLSGRHLVFSPRFPSIALPLVAMAVPLVDALVALPVLVVMVAIEGRLAPVALLFPVLLALEFVLIAGISLITASLNVFVRDVQNIVTVVLLLLFYLTPVFYGLRSLPERFQPILRANPMTAMVESMRAVLLDGRLPGLGDVVRIVVAAGVCLAVGLLCFQGLEPRFVDEL
jgi:ABC-type polysaccharide/polyol phosphate export permease